MKTIELKITQVFANDENPRFISDTKFSQMVQSLKDFPEMAKVRPLIINENNLVLGGNMRLKAMQEAGWTHVPCIKVAWSEEKQREFILKDNVSYGEWDWQILNSNWDKEMLTEFGLDFPASDYNPNLTPSFSDSDVTAEDMEKQQYKMSMGDAIASKIDVICPDCGHEFQIKNMHN